MANQSISQLPVATTLTGDELTVVVQGGVTKQTQVSDIANVVIPGKLIDYLYFDGDSNLIVVYTDSTTQNLGPIPGFISAYIAPNGHLILVNSDGGTTDAGSVFATLSQTFLTGSNEASTLPNSQQLIAGSNITLTPGTNSLTISTSGASGSLNGAGTGIIVKDSSTTVVSRTLTSSAGISITNPNGIAGNPLISPSSKLADLQNLATTGILAVVGGTTVVDRNIVGTASQIDVVNGDGSGNPTISINDNPVLPGTGSVTIPTGTTIQRPGALAGQLRFNSQLDVFEGQNSSGVWQTISLGAGVTSVGVGTGLQSDTTNPITSAGVISISATGVTTGTYGSSSQVGQFTVNAQGQITGATNVTITPASIGGIDTVNGAANEITSNQVGTVVTLSLPTALTFTGKTVTNGTFNMATATVGGDTVTTNTATQTLTGKSISGLTNTLTNIGNSSLVNSSVTIGTDTLSLGGTLTTFNGVSISGSANTLSNIGNSSLTNSQITLGTTNISLGGTALAPVGLTSVTVTQNPTTDFQLATKQYVDNLVATGTTYHTPVYVESPDSAGNLNATYNQPGGAGDGVGATLTNAGTQVALTVDGVLTTVGMRVLIYNQTNGFENGVYTVTVVGNGSTNWVLTRATDADTYGPGADALDQGSTFYVVAGATGAGELYTCTTSGVIVFGTTNITFAQIGATQIYSAGTGLSLTGTQFSISNTAVTAGTYGTDARSMTLAVNAQGQITSLFDQPISIAASQINTTIPNSGLTNSAITIGATSVSLGSTISTFAGVSISGATNTLSNIGNSSLTNSAITINGSSVSLGGSITVTATASNALTIGTGLSGTSYNGSAPVTIAISNTGVTANSYGAASKTLTATVNAQGQLTALADTDIAISNTQVSGLGTMSTQNANAVAITGGNVDGTIIGATTKAAGSFTTVTATTGIFGGTF